MKTHPLLAVKRLLTADQRCAVDIATGATKPIPASNIEECRELLTEPRHISVNDHAAWRESLAPKPPLDEIDELVAELRQLKPEGESL